jgi:DNA-binding transcriptional LysR family regulator
MDRLDAMKVFAAVVDAGSLSAAGRRLAMPLATVSRKLSELESHLGARLLTRSTRGRALTDAGEAYLAACRRILDEVAEAERAAAGEYSAPQGELVVAAPLAFGRQHVLPVIDAFLLEFPAVDIRLVLGDRVTPLMDEHIDLAVRIGTLPDSRLNALPLGTLRRVVCASPGYLAQHGRPRVPADLARHCCVTFEGLGAADAWTFTTAASHAVVPIRSRLVVNSAEAAVDAAVAGIGLVRVLSYQADAARRARQLQVLLAKFEPPPTPVNLVYDARQRVALKLRAFIDFAAPRLRQRLAGLA